MFDDQFLCTDVGFEIGVSSSAAIIIFSESYLWIILFIKTYIALASPLKGCIVVSDGCLAMDYV